MQKITKDWLSCWLYVITAIAGIYYWHDDKLLVCVGTAIEAGRDGYHCTGTPRS